MGDQSAQHGVGMLGVAQVPGAIELVQAREGKAGGVANVVQPCGGFHQIGVSAENGCQAACPGGDALGVRPAAGERLLQELPGQLFGPGSQRVHVAQASPVFFIWDRDRCSVPDVKVLLTWDSEGV
jgi:hypothetical protein